MSPFMYTHRITSPLLIIHGENDDNAGTFPIQSQRLYAALKGLGKVSRLVVFPGESHTFLGYDSIMHMLWEMKEWLNKYVKNKSRM